MLTGPKQAGSIDRKLNNLRVTNWILAAAVIIALVSILLGLIQNRKLRLEKKQLQLQLQMSATVAPCDSTRPGDIVPPIEAYTPAGQRVSIVYTGSSRHLLFIFSTQCSACVGQFPNWNEISKRARSKNVVVVGLATDRENVPIHAGGLNFELLSIRDDAILRAYRINVVPSVMLVSEHGRTQWVRSGSLSEDSIRELFSILDGDTVVE